MADKKLTYQMISPGEAWNNFVNSKEGHNAAAVTPSWLAFDKKYQQKNNMGNIPEKKTKPCICYEAMKQKDLKTEEKEIQVAIEIGTEKER